MAASTTSKSGSTKVTPDMPASWRYLPANKRWDLNPNAYQVEFAGDWNEAKARLVAKRASEQRAAVVMNLATGLFELRVPRSKK